MHPPRIVSAALLLLLAGCAGLPVGDTTESTLDLTVQNDGTEPIAIDVTVTAPDGSVVDEASDEIGASVGRAFTFTTAEPGRHEVRVEGANWAVEGAWDAGECATDELTVRITGDDVESDGGCMLER